MGLYVFNDPTKLHVLIIDNFVKKRHNITHSCIFLFPVSNTGVHLNQKLTVALARPSSKTTLAQTKLHSRAILNLNLNHFKCERRRRELNFVIYLKINVFCTVRITINLTFALARVSSKTTVARIKRRSHTRPCDR